MADILRDDLAQRLHKVAIYQQRSVDEIVEDLLNRYEAELLSDEEDVPSFRLAASAEKMPPFGEEENVAEKADEILRNEFADYLLARMNRPADETNSH